MWCVDAKQRNRLRWKINTYASHHATIGITALRWRKIAYVNTKVTNVETVVEASSYLRHKRSRLRNRNRIRRSCRRSYHHHPYLFVRVMVEWLEQFKRIYNSFSVVVCDENWINCVVTVVVKANKTNLHRIRRRQRNHQTSYRPLSSPCRVAFRPMTSEFWKRKRINLRLVLTVFEMNYCIGAFERMDFQFSVDEVSSLEILYSRFSSITAKNCQAVRSR